MGNFASTSFISINSGYIDPYQLLFPVLALKCCLLHKPPLLLGFKSQNPSLPPIPRPILLIQSLQTRNFQVVQVLPLLLRSIQYFRHQNACIALQVRWHRRQIANIIYSQAEFETDDWPVACDFQPLGLRTFLLGALEEGLGSFQHAGGPHLYGRRTEWTVGKSLGVTNYPAPP